MLQLLNTTFQKPLLGLGLVVTGVLADVALFLRLFDTLGDLWPSHIDQEVQFFLELLAALRRQENFLHGPLTPLLA